MSVSPLLLNTAASTNKPSPISLLHQGVPPISEGAILLLKGGKSMSSDTNEMTLNLGVLSVPENRIRRIVCWLPKWLAGTRQIESGMKLFGSNFNIIETRIGAMSDVLNIIVADISAEWTSEKRERVQKAMWNFGLVTKGLSAVIAKENPFTQQELDTLRAYTQQAQQGEVFTPQQATEFRNLSERASREYSDQDWVGELLKIALFIFAVYAVSQILKKN